MTVPYYAVVDDFRVGVPQTILAGGLKPRGIACHTTEGGDGEAGALGTISFLIAEAGRNASYHELWYPKSGGFEARRIVRPDRASHSMMPAQPPWAPGDRVRRILGDRWWDPNGASYAVSVAGSTAKTAPALIRDRGFMLGARRRTDELLEQFRGSLSPDPLYNHGEGQANRTDWGTQLRGALEEIDMEWANRITYIQPELVEYRPETSYRRRPDLSEASRPIVLNRTSVRRVIGKVAGFDFGAGPDWDVLVSGTEGLLVAHPQDRRWTKALVPEDAATPSEEQLAQAFRAGRDRAANAYTDAGQRAALAVQP